MTPSTPAAASMSEGAPPVAMLAAMALSLKTLLPVPTTWVLASSSCVPLAKLVPPGRFRGGPQPLEVHPLAGPTNHGAAFGAVVDRRNHLAVKLPYAAGIAAGRSLSLRRERLQELARAG